MPVSNHLLLFTCSSQQLWHFIQLWKIIPKVLKISVLLEREIWSNSVFINSLSWRRFVRCFSLQFLSQVFTASVYSLTELDLQWIVPTIWYVLILPNLSVSGCFRSCYICEACCTAFCISSLENSWFNFSLKFYFFLIFLWIWKYRTEKHIYLVT